MNKENLIKEIDESISNLTNKDFLTLWNNLFEEESIYKIDSLKQREDISNLLIEELEFFELNKLKKIYKFIETKM